VVVSKAQSLAVSTSVASTWPMLAAFGNLPQVAPKASASVV